MENQFQNTDSDSTSTTSLVVRVLKGALGQPIYLVAVAALIIGSGLYLNWATMVALGFAPLILTLTPCALMCAFGLCGMAGSKNKDDGKPPSREDLS